MQYVKVAKLALIVSMFMVAGCGGPDARIKTAAGALHSAVRAACDAVNQVRELILAPEVRAAIEACNAYGDGDRTGAEVLHAVAACNLEPRGEQ